MRKYYFLMLPFLIACLSLQVTAQVNLQQGLVAYYPFNGNANDESGNGNHGLVYGATLTEDRFGNANSAYYFNNNFIDIPNSTTFTMTQITVTAWIKLSQFVASGQARIINRQSSQGGVEAWGLQIFKYNLPGNFLTFHANNCIHALNIISDTHLSTHTWYHVVGVNDGQNLKLYINGFLDKSIPSLGYLCTNNSANVRIGRIGPVAMFYFPGTIDDIRIYNRALNEQEIYTLYTGGQPPQTNTISNILINQRNDGSGMVDVYYSLNGTGSQYNISLQASFDGGNTYTAIPASFLSGDVSNISPGTNKHIVWDGLGSFPNTYSTATKLKIIANTN